MRKAAKTQQDVLKDVKGKVDTGSREVDHWVLVEEMKATWDPKAKFVAFKIFNYGTSVRIGPFEFDDFFEDYGGFVVADSRPVADIEK